MNAAYVAPPSGVASDEEIRAGRQGAIRGDEGLGVLDLLVETVRAQIDGRPPPTLAPVDASPDC